MIVYDFKASFDFIILKNEAENFLEILLLWTNKNLHCASNINILRNGSDFFIEFFFIFQTNKMSMFLNSFIVSISKHLVSTISSFPD